MLRDTPPRVLQRVSRTVVAVQLQADATPKRSALQALRVALYNQQVRRAVKAALRRNEALRWPDVARLDARVREHCQRDADLRTDECAHGVWRALQQNDVLYGPLRARAVALLGALRAYTDEHAHTTSFTDAVAQRLTVLRDAPTLHDAVRLLECEPRRVDTGIVTLDAPEYSRRDRLCAHVLGEHHTQRTAMLACLVRWCNASTACASIGRVLHERCAEQRALAYAHRVAHPWDVTREQARDTLQRIGMDVALRTLHTGVPLYDALHVDGREVAPSNDTDAYLCTLLALLSGAPVDDALREQVALLRLWARFAWQPLERYYEARVGQPIAWDDLDCYAAQQYACAKTTRDDWLAVRRVLLGCALAQHGCTHLESVLASHLLRGYAVPLRLLSISCWAHANEYARRRFHALFAHRLYAVRVEQGSRAAVQTDGAGSVIVTQQKRYTLRHRLRVEDAACYGVDETRGWVARMRFEWRVVYTAHDQRYAATLRVLDHECCASLAPDAQWNALRALAEYNAPNNVMRAGDCLRESPL